MAARSRQNCAGRCEEGHLSVTEAGPDAAHNVFRIHLAVLICQLGELSPLRSDIKVLGRLILLRIHSSTCDMIAKYMPHADLPCS